MTPSDACCSTLANQVRMSVKGQVSMLGFTWMCLWACYGLQVPLQPRVALTDSTEQEEHDAATATAASNLRSIASHNTATTKKQDKLTIETPLVRDIIHQQYTHRASIIRRRDRPESFLSSRVPYLQFHALAIEFYRADLEVYANRRDE